MPIDDDGTAVSAKGRIALIRYRMSEMIPYRVQQLSNLFRDVVVLELIIVSENTS
jgi:hypothetical protein